MKVDAKADLELYCFELYPGSALYGFRYIFSACKQCKRYLCLIDNALHRPS